MFFVRTEASLFGAFGAAASAAAQLRFLPRRQPAQQHSCGFCLVSFCLFMELAAAGGVAKLATRV
jgi:hypothetical protein